MVTFWQPGPAGEPPVRVRLDADRVRAETRKLRRADAIAALESLVARMKPHELLGFAEEFLPVRALREPELAPHELLREVRLFHAATLRGDYHEAFHVTARTAHLHSLGTLAFLEEFRTLLGGCLRAASRAPSMDVVSAFDRLFDLVRRLDRGAEGLVFFAREPGSRHLAWDPATALPSYFRCLASSASPGRYARSVLRAIDTLAPAQRARLLASARRSASEAQRAALRRATTAGTGHRRSPRRRSSRGKRTEARP